MAYSRPRPHPLLFAMMGIVVGTIFGVLAYHNWSRDEALRDHGQEVGAQVVDITSSGRGRHVVVVEFTTADGRQIRARVKGRQNTAGAHVGDEFPIRYDTRHPTGDVHDARRADQYKLTYLLSTIALAALIVPSLIARKAFAHST